MRYLESMALMQQIFEEIPLLGKQIKQLSSNLSNQESKLTPKSYKPETLQLSALAQLCIIFLTPIFPFCF